MTMTAMYLLFGRQVSSFAIIINRVWKVWSYLLSCKRRKMLLVSDCQRRAEKKNWTFSRTRHKRGVEDKGRKTRQEKEAHENVKKSRETEVNPLQRQSVWLLMLIRKWEQDCKTLLIASSRRVLMKHKRRTFGTFTKIVMTHEGFFNISFSHSLLCVPLFSFLFSLHLVHNILWFYISFLS